MELKKLIKYYYMLKPEHQRNMYSDNVEVPRNLTEDMTSILEELRNLHVIEYQKEDKKDLCNLKIEKYNLYNRNDSSAFELKIFLPLSRKPNLRYFVLIDERGYHVAEIDANYIKSSVAIDAKDKERFKEIITQKFRNDLEKLLN